MAKKTWMIGIGAVIFLFVLAFVFLNKPTQTISIELPQLIAFQPTEDIKLDFCSTKDACISFWKSQGIIDSQISQIEPNLFCENNICFIRNMVFSHG